MSRFGILNLNVSLCLLLNSQFEFPVIELESEKAKVQQMQAVYDAQDFTPQDVERINIKRREVQRQIDDINRRCQSEDQEICAEELVLSKEIEQVGRFNMYTTDSII